MAAKTKLRFGSDLRAQARVPLSDFRRALQADPKRFLALAQECVDKGLFDLRTVPLRDLYAATADVEVPVVQEIAGQARAVTTSAFPLLTGGLVVAALNEAYEALPTIGQELVTERTDNKAVTTIAGILSEDLMVDEVKEGAEFPPIGAGEEKFQILSKRNGRRLAISAELMEESDNAGLLDRINALAEIASDWIEEQTIQRVYDTFGSGSSAAEPYCLRLNGSGTSLYSATANTPGTRAPSGTQVLNNALVDETDLENARTVLAAMTNSRGKRINVRPAKLVVPNALVGTASKLLNSEYVPGVLNEVSNWGPRGRYMPELISSPKIDAYTTTSWLLGDPQRQFVRKNKLAMEFVSLVGTGTVAYLRTRTVAEYRIAWDVEIGARDYVYVVRNLSGTAAATSPTGV